MRTRSSSNLPVVSPSNPSTSNPKRHNHKRSKQPFILEKSPIDTMADQRTMAELLCAPTEGRSRFLNAVAGGNLLERRTQDVLTIIEYKSKVRNSQNKAVVSQVKSCDVNSNSSSEIAKLTHAVNHGYNFSKLQDNIQGYVSTAAINYNQGNYVYCLPGSGSLPRNIVATPKGELKAITTRSGIVLDGPTVPTPPPFINPKEDERVEETLTDPDLAKYTIKVPPPPVQKYKPLSQREYVLHQRDTLHLNIPNPSRMLKQKQQEKDKKMLKALMSNKEKLQERANTPLNENCPARNLIDTRKRAIIQGTVSNWYKAKTMNGYDDISETPHATNTTSTHEA
nr:hypothetical protein [Tanacetum cinerariifolium]